MSNRLGKALGAALLLLSVSAGSVLAGEVTGTGEPTPVKGFVANSICAFSGLNDHPEGHPEEGPGGRTQNWGTIPKEVRDELALHGEHPGDACRGFSASAR